MFKKLSTLTLALTVGTGLFVTSCASQDWKSTENGLEYKIIKKGDGKTENQVGYIAELNVIFKIGDSVIVNTLDLNNNEPVPQMMQEAAFPGDLPEGLLLMRAGDKWDFRILADTVVARTGQALPPFAKEGDYYFWEVEMVNLMSPEEMEQKRLEEEAEQIKIDDELLQKYFADNNIKAEKTASGLYYVIHEAGSGATPENGQMVSVNYTGMKMNGEKFDSNVDPAFNHVKPLQFTLGQGQVIRGWDEGIALLKRGEKATLYIPSSLAYGKQAPPAIGPDQVLIFDVELLDFN